MYIKSTLLSVLFLLSVTSALPVEETEPTNAATFPPLTWQWLHWHKLKPCIVEGSGHHPVKREDAADDLAPPPEGEVLIDCIGEDEVEDNSAVDMSIPPVTPTRKFMNGKGPKKGKVCKSGPIENHPPEN